VPGYQGRRMVATLCRGLVGGPPVLRLGPHRKTSRPRSGYLPVTRGGGVVSSTPAETAHADQLGAAVHESNRIMRRMVASLDGTIHFRVPATGWKRDVIERHNAANRAGTGRACNHSDSPQPLFAAAWHPGLTVCADCAEAGALYPADEVDNWTCDSCHRYLPDQIAVSALQAGSNIMLVGLCPDCRHV
jgi:hypothetical protein